MRTLKGTPLTLAILGVLLIAAAAGATSGALPVGSVIPGGEDRAFEHGAPSPEQTVLATGTAPVGGPWRLTTYRSEGITDHNGDLMEAKGLPCIRLLLTAPPPANPTNGSAFCLAPGKATFNASSIPVVDESSGRSELVIYGFAPRSAARVRLIPAHGKTVHANTEEGGAAFPGNVWVVAAPPELEAAELEWLDRSGERDGVKLDVAHHFDRLGGTE